MCARDAIPAGVRSEGPFAALRVAGTLDFALTGILASLTAPLAEADVSAFALSTFDTDYLLVPREPRRGPGGAHRRRAPGRRIAGVIEEGAAARDFTLNFYPRADTQRYSRNPAASRASCLVW